MITRQRYFVKMKPSMRRRLPPKDVEARVGLTPTERPTAPMVAHATPPLEWWQDKRAATAIAVLVVAIVAGLFMLKGKTMQYGPDTTAASAAPATSNVSRAGMPRQQASSANQSRGYTSIDPLLPTDESFMATFGGRQKGAPAPVRTASLSSQTVDFDEKIVLPDNVSGECSIGNGGTRDINDCFRRHGARNK